MLKSGTTFVTPTIAGGEAVQVDLPREEYPDLCELYDSKSQLIAELEGRRRAK